MCITGVANLPVCGGGGGGGGGGGAVCYMCGGSHACVLCEGVVMVSAGVWQYRCDFQ